MYLPLSLTPDVWLRYKYTLDDIRVTLHAHPPELVTQLTLLLGITITQKQVQPNSTDDVARTFISKSPHIRRIVDRIPASWPILKEYKQSVLDKVHLEHVPPLPIVHVTPQLYQEAQEKLLPPDYDIDFYDDNKWNGALVNWSDIQLLPTCQDPKDHSILCWRMIKWSVYSSSGRNITIPICRPAIFIIQGVRYARVEEACFFKIHNTTR